ncbi:MAG: hypothetical protein ACREON_12355, partial [Gemmatimonadaceae bacterium]
MPPRTLASLAHALGAASDLDTALVSLGEALADLDRAATVSLLRFDARRQLLRERITPVDGRIARARVDTTFDHLPSYVQAEVTAGGRFVDLGEQSQEYAHLMGFGGSQQDDALLALRGVLVDGVLTTLVALYEPRRFFGTRVMERFVPYVALFELAFARFAERDAREEAVRTLEDVTQRVHGEYVRRLADLEQQLARARETPSHGSQVVHPERLLALEAESAK